MQELHITYTLYILNKIGGYFILSSMTNGMIIHFLMVDKIDCVVKNNKIVNDVL